MATDFTRIQNKSGSDVNEVLNYQQRCVPKELSECIQTTLCCNNFYLAFHFITKMFQKDHQSFSGALKVYLTGSNIKERRGGGSILRSTPVTKVVPVWVASPLCLIHGGS